MGAPSNDLQNFFEIQMEQNNEKNKIFKIQNCDILFKMFLKKTLNLSRLKRHIFFIISSF